MSINKEPEPRRLTKADLLVAGGLVLGALGAEVVVNNWQSENSHSISGAGLTTGEILRTNQDGVLVVREDVIARLTPTRLVSTPQPVPTLEQVVAKPVPTKEQSLVLAVNPKDALSVTPVVTGIAPLVVPPVSKGEMSDKEMTDRGIDPHNDIHNIADCLKPGFVSVKNDQSLAQRVISWLTFAPLVAEASPEYKTKGDVIKCLKEQLLLIALVRNIRGVDLSTIKESDVKGEVTYRELPQFLADQGLMSLAEAQKIFGTYTTMTFKDGGVITSRTATMVENQGEADRLIAEHKKTDNYIMFYPKDGRYEVIVIDGQALVLRENCANILLWEKPEKVAQVSPSPTVSPLPTIPPVSSTPATQASLTPTRSAETASVTPTAIHIIPNTPTAAPTNTETLPANTPGRTATLVPTRTPGGDTPTPIGTRPSGSTPRPATPTEAPTQVAVLPTLTKGPTEAPVPTRTTAPSVPSPTAIRALPNSPTPVSASRPNTPTSVPAGP